MSGFSDALTLRAYCAEVIARYPLPWFVQKISRIGDHDFLISCRLGPGRSFRWRIGLQPGSPSLSVWHGPKPPATSPSAFIMLCRKHLQGRSLDACESGYPERLVRFVGREVTLVLELLDRQPNLLLLNDAQEIMGGFRLGRSDERDLRPRRAYHLPPRPELPNAEDLTATALEEIHRADPPAWPGSVATHSFGLSPRACRRLSREPKELLASWRELWAHTLPGHYRAEREGDGRLHIWGKLEQGARALLELEGEEQPPAPPALDSARSRARVTLRKARARLATRLLKLAQDREKVGEADRMQRDGELLLTYGASLPRGATVARLKDWDGETDVEVTLDPSLSALDNARKRLRRAAKLRRSADVVTARWAQTEEEMAAIDTRAARVETAFDEEELRQIMAAHATPGTSAAAPAKKTGVRRYTLGSWLFLVGRSPRQNDLLVRRLSARDDLWFHVKDAPGAHVVLKTAGRAPDTEAVEAGAALAARYSSRARDTQALVSFTAAQHVRKPSGSAPGFVLYEQELTLTTQPGQLPDGLQRVVE